MNESRINSVRRLVPPLCDALLALWLLTEVAMAHTALSRICMLLFMLGAGIYALMEKRLYISWWMAAYAILILWGALVSMRFAIDRGVSLSMLKTLALNAAFFFMLYQYLVLRADMRRFMGAFVLSICALSLYLLVRQIPLGAWTSRLGEAGGVNANWIGMLCAFAASMCLVLSKNRSKPRASKWWLVPLLPFAISIVLTRSIKAMALFGVLAVVTLLIVYPRRWGLKLLILALLGGALLYFFVLQNNIISTTVLFRIRVTVLTLLKGDAYAGAVYAESLIERGALTQAGLDAIRLRPLTGWGLNCFQLLEGANGTYSHNNYIELAVSGGVILPALWYLPQLLMLIQAARGARRAKREGRESLFVCVCALYLVMQIVMDIAMVSYFDRTSAIFLILLAAAIQIRDGAPDDGTRLFAYLQNPNRLFVKLAEKGWFRRMDDETYLKRFYRGKFGVPLRLDPPVTMNEKLQYLKLHDRDPMHTALADKVSVRDYVSQRAGEAVLVPLLGVWDDPDEIEIDKLPERFVLKCTHDSGGVFLCADKSTFDWKRVKRALKKRLKKNYYWVGREWPYRDVKPRVLAEAFIGEADGSRPDDYKFFCFDGVARAIVVCTNRVGKHASYYFFTRAYEPLRVNRDTAALPEGSVLPRPAHLDEMLSLAETLSAGVKHVRVDLYDTPEGVRFGEMTFFDQSGFADDYVGDGDAVMGAFLDLEDEA